MTPSRPKPAAHSTPADTTGAVDTFMLALQHPFKSEVETLRHLILGEHPSIAEGIKWKAPSFRTTEYFSTVNLRAKVGICLILHLGARVRETSETGVAVRDPERLLVWLARDRAAITVTDAEDLSAEAAAFTQSSGGGWLTCDPFARVRQG
jgi:hypothetical protein